MYIYLEHIHPGMVALGRTIATLTSTAAFSASETCTTTTDKNLPGTDRM